MKKCTKCGIEKELSEFYKDKYTKDTITSHCKQCRKQYQQAHKKQSVLYTMKHRETEKGKLTHRRAQEKYRKTEKGILTQKRYTKSEKQLFAWQKHHYKRKHLGFNILITNDWNEPVEWHHINDTDVVPIPSYLHRMCYTGDRKQHRLICNRLIRILYPEIEESKYDR